MKSKKLIVGVILVIAAIAAWFFWSLIITAFIWLFALSGLTAGRPPNAIFAIAVTGLQLGAIPVLLGVSLVFGVISTVVRMTLRLKFLPASLYGLLFVLALAAFSFGGGLAVRSLHRQRYARLLAVHTPNGIQEGMYVTIGGIAQWIQIDGEDRNNPVILFVHGGAGASTLALSSGWRAWEKYFTVVQWDQRGAGRTYRRTGSSIAPTMTVDRMALDGVEVAEFLRMHLHKNKIIMVGHSWGSFLAIHMLKLRPDLFSAYVGTGQVVGGPPATPGTGSQDPPIASTSEVEVTAGLGRLVEAVIPPANSADLSLRSIAGATVRIPPMQMPDFSLLDRYYDLKGFVFSVEILDGRDGPMGRTDLRSLGLDFSVPIFLFEGTKDTLAPIDRAEQYLKDVRAPRREFVRFDGADHFLPMNRSGLFLKELVDRVRPLAAE